MAIVRWSPFSVDPFEEFDSFFEKFYGPAMKSIKGFMPAADVYQTKDAVIVEMPLAGVDPDKVDISIENDVLTVKGTMDKKTEVEDKNYFRREIRSGSFYRTLPLPAHVVGEKASAMSENGMLKISVPKRTEENKAVKVKVKGKKSEK